MEKTLCDLSFSFWTLFLNSYSLFVVVVGDVLICLIVDQNKWIRPIWNNFNFFLFNQFSDHFRQYWTTLIVFIFDQQFFFILFFWEVGIKNMALNISSSWLKCSWHAKFQLPGQSRNWVSMVWDKKRRRAKELT